MELQFDQAPLSLNQLARIRQSGTRINLSQISIDLVEKGHDCLNTILASGKTVYGINTGFGLLARERISSDELGQLQQNLVLSHAVGTGAPLSDSVVRLILALKIKALSQGLSGVRSAVIELLIEMLNADALPVIPGKGSVGASGDLAPLAHLACAMIGQGEIRLRGRRQSSRDALQAIGVEPIELGPKEGLALLNGTQVSTALAIDALVQSQHLFNAALVSGAMSVDAAMGSDTPFDSRIHAARPHAGQVKTASYYRRLLDGSEIRHSHLECDRVQDPYSLRCQPQVMGACFDQLSFVESQLICEANSVTDNPLIFADSSDVLSGGNFHAEPVAMAADTMALAIAEMGSLAERRIALLIDRHLSNLPPFLVENGGLNSGFMIAHVTAAAVASENKSLAHPASVDSLPTSANQEDHVSMATYASRRLNDMIDNTNTIVAIELLAAAQGVEFRRPLKSSPLLEKVHATIRESVPKYDEDRYFADDIENAKQLVHSGQLTEIANLDDVFG